MLLNPVLDKAKPLCSIRNMENYCKFKAKDLKVLAK